MAFKQPDLPYDLKALAPFVSEEQMHYHYNKHHAAYFKNLNGLVEGKPESDLELEEDTVGGRGRWASLGTDRHDRDERDACDGKEEACERSGKAGSGSDAEPGEEQDRHALEAAVGSIEEGLPAEASLAVEDTEGNGVTTVAGEDSPHEDEERPERGFMESVSESVGEEKNRRESDGTDTDLYPQAALPDSPHSLRLPGDEM